MQNKKILFILCLPPPYHGSNISNETLWNSKITESFDCDLLDISDKRNIDNLGGFDLTNVKLALKNIFQLIWKIRKTKPALIYLLVSQNNLAYFRDGLFIIFSKLFSQKSKVVIHLRGSYFGVYYKNTNFFMKKFIELSMRRVNAGIVLGDGLKYIFEDWIKDIYTVPNGTDIFPTINLEDKFKKNNTSGKIIITWLSSLLKSKGLLVFLESVPLVIEKHPNVEFKIAGEWGDDPFTQDKKDETKSKATEIINKYGINSHLNFISLVKGQDKQRLLFDTDIFVLPTIVTEGHPRAIIEAMSAGNPVISTPIGAIPDTVIDGETGFLIEPQNPNMLADRIIKLIEDEELRRKMSISARKRYEELYTKEKFIDNMIRVFNKVLMYKGPIK
ncbi:MAG: glycosyltransferase family 4 protein [Proteobacteria bacterium]|nr:glycosyltransferase family 4 protein [Pseudomonadota bacterium]